MIVHSIILLLKFTEPDYHLSNLKFGVDANTGLPIKDETVKTT